jgi:2-polyprenyl-3-methyl-5-hydroxy-6-metoxy-1,4-benzoquinol methylase
MDYKEKLKDFNSTEKYKEEMQFICDLLELNDNDSVLDYGCGIGTLCEKIQGYGVSCVGYDKTRFVDEEKTYFVDNLEKYYFSKLIFMHSLAHIENPVLVLSELKKRVFENIIVVTPNKDWLELNSNPNYIPDPTVVEHFTLYSLTTLFLKCGFKINQVGQFGKQTANQNERLFIKVSV